MLTMGRRGPQPKPTELKKLLGNPGRRRLSESEPVAPVAAIAPPPLLRSNARAYWDSMAPMLIQMRVLTAADVNTFARYCNLLARYKQLDEFLMEKGASGTTYVIKDGNGKARGAAEFPQAWEYRQVLNQLLTHEREFGLTPASRSRLSVEPASTAPAAEPIQQKDAALRDFFRAGGPKRKPAAGA